MTRAPYPINAAWRRLPINALAFAGACASAAIMIKLLARAHARDRSYPLTPGSVCGRTDPMRSLKITTLHTHISVMPAGCWRVEHAAFVRMLYAVQPATHQVCPFCYGDFDGCACEMVMLRDNRESGIQTYSVTPGRER